MAKMNNIAQLKDKRHSWRKPDSMNIVFILLGALILLFIFLPLITTITSSSPGRLWNTLLQSQVYQSILLTIYAALIATLIGTFLGVPLAYLLARHNFRGKGILEGLIDVPIVVPHSAAGLALLFIFGRKCLLGKAFSPIGISFVDSVAGVVIAMLFVSVPFLIDSVRDGFKSVDPRLEKVSRTLGASSWQTFFKISLPLAWRSIFSGSILMWARGMSEFGAVLMLAYWVTDFFGISAQVAPILVADSFNIELGYCQALTALVILIALILFSLARLIAYRGRTR
jgi:molybdate/tungstate transport system permease protein